MIRRGTAKLVSCRCSYWGLRCWWWGLGLGQAQFSCFYGPVSLPAQTWVRTEGPCGVCSPLGSSNNAFAEGTTVKSLQGCNERLDPLSAAAAKRLSDSFSECSAVADSTSLHVVIEEFVFCHEEEEVFWYSSSLVDFPGQNCGFSSLFWMSQAADMAHPGHSRAVHGVLASSSLWGSFASHVRWKEKVWCLC